MSRPAQWERMLAMDGDTVDLQIERATIEEGRTLSADAIEAARDTFLVWVGTRIMRRWEATNEPPTAVTITITVDAH